MFLIRSLTVWILTSDWSHKSRESESHPLIGQSIAGLNVMEGARVPTVQAHLNADHGCSVYKVSEPQYTERVEMSEEEGQDEALRPLANIDSTCCHVSVDNSFHLKHSFVTREG